MKIIFVVLAVFSYVALSKAQDIVEVPLEESFPALEESFGYPEGQESFGYPEGQESFANPDQEAESFYPYEGQPEVIPTNTDFVPRRTEVVFMFPRRPTGFSSIFDKLFGGSYRPSFHRIPQFSSFFPQFRPTGADEEDQNETSLDFPSFFDRPLTPQGGFPSLDFPSIFSQGETDQNETDSLFPSFDHPIFDSVPDFHSLPDNYTNSTHDVHYVDDKKVVVNSTVEKSSGPNFKKFYHFQVFHSQPHGEEPVVTDEEPSTADEEPAVTGHFPEVDLDANRGDTPLEREPLDTSYNNAEFPALSPTENEISVPKKLVQVSPSAQ